MKSVKEPFFRRIVKRLAHWLYHVATGVSLDVWRDGAVKEIEQYRKLWLDANRGVWHTYEMASQSAHYRGWVQGRIDFMAGRQEYTPEKPLAR